MSPSPKQHRTAEPIGLSLESLADQVRPLLNDLCVACHDTEVRRLIGVMEDPMDLYYTLQDRMGRVSHFTAVGHCESLRAGLTPAYYASLDSLFVQGGSPHVPELRIERRDTEPDFSSGTTPSWWLSDFRRLLSMLGLAAPVSLEELGADLDAQMRRVLREVGKLYDKERTSAPPGFRLQPIAEFDASNKMIREHHDLVVLLRRVAYALEQRDPGNPTAGSAHRYLERIGEAGKPLRDQESAP